MAEPNRTVCLRAFNESLDGGEPWRPKPSLPPIPKRIAWPGGKIVSNKSEALANFLKRKLDQGETLTPEQKSMLESMVSEPADAHTTAQTQRMKRKLNEAGGGAWARGRISGVDAKVLLHKLEKKIAHASNPEESMSEGRSLDSSSRLMRRTVDLSFVKRQAKKTSSHATEMVTMNEVAEAVVGRRRRVLSDGQGGFTIATVSTSRAGLWRPKKGDTVTISSHSPGIYRSDKTRVNGVVSAGSKGKSKAFVPNKGRVKAGKWSKKTPSLIPTGNATVARAATNGGKSISVACGRNGVKEIEPRSLEELMNGGLAASR